MHLKPFRSRRIGHTYRELIFALEQEGKKLKVGSKEPSDSPIFHRSHHDTRQSRIKVARKRARRFLAANKYKHFE